MKLKKIFESCQTNNKILIELLVPSCNHYSEIIENYSHLFNISEIKITILESKVTTDILTLDSFNNISLFERLVDDPAEYFLIYYMNEIYEGKHPFFFIYADEYVSYSELQKLFTTNYSIIYVNRYEFFYKSNSGLYAKQLRGGFYEFLSEINDNFDFKKSFHDFWEYTNDANFNYKTIDTFHLHNYNVLIDYGKSSKYVYEEIKMLKKYNYFRLYFLKRFFLRLLSRLFNIKLLFYNYKIYFYLLFAQIIESSNAILLIIENKLKK